MPSTIKVEIKRQANPDASAVTEKFEIPYRPGMNITSLLGEIALNPTTIYAPHGVDLDLSDILRGTCSGVEWFTGSRRGGKKLSGQRGNASERRLRWPAPGSS